MSLQITPPQQIFYDKDGTPLDAGFIYVGELSQNPETNQVAVYWDAAMTQPAPQPIRTLNGYVSRQGVMAKIYTDSSFSITVRNKRGELVFSSSFGNSNGNNYALLVFPDYATASAAAATLPDGQEIEAPNADGRLSRFEVQSGALVFKDFAPDAIRMQSYIALRAYIGKAQAIDITSPGVAGRFYLDVSDTTTADNGGTIIVDASNRRWKRVIDGAISVKWFGAKGDGSTDDTASIAAARNYIAASLAAGNRRKLIFPAGRYLYSQSPNWAINRLDLEFEGEVWLINTGTDSSFLIDGGETGPGVLGLKIKGYPLVYGGASTANGYFLRSVHRSDLELNCRGAGSSYAGLYMAWCVSNTVKFIMNFNEGGLYNTPARGMLLTSRVANEETSYNTFINPECSGMPVGIYEDASLGNLFIGGAVQACTNVGLQQTSNCWNSKFIGTDFEVNTNGDVECNARESQFIGVDMEKKITLQTAAVNCSVIGGAIQDIVVNSGATRTLLSGVTYNRFGGGNITDNGTQTRYRDVRDKFSGIVSNTPRAKTTVSVGASPFTYTNTTGNEIDLIITGGTVSQLVYTRFAGDAISPPQGMFRLSPGDSMTMTYSVAPTVLEYTR